jgi:hypothetical protein
MNITFYPFLLSALLLLGCNDIPIQPDASNQPENSEIQSNQLLTIHPEPAEVSSFSETEPIGGNTGKQINSNEYSVMVDEDKLITIPPRPGGGPSFSVTETIDGNLGGVINLNEYYVTVDGDTVRIIVKLEVKRDSFSGSEDITITIDDVHAAVKFAPKMVFEIPVLLDVKYKGLDPDQLNLTYGNYEFLYIGDDGKTEMVPSNGVFVKQNIGQITVKKAQLSHFSRYAFFR